MVTGRAMDSFLVTCEHGGNRVPAPCRRLFRGQRRAARLPPRIRPRGAGDGEGFGRRPVGAARDLDRQPPRHRPQSLARTSAALVVGDAWRAAGAPDEHRRTALPPLSRGSRAPCSPLAVARSPRDPRLVAQLHAGAGRQGAAHGRGVAVRPCPARRSAALCPVEGVARAHRAAGPGTPQLSLCRQGRWPDFGAARSLSPTAPTSGSSSRSISGSSSPRGRRWTALRGALIESFRTACAG